MPATANKAVEADFAKSGTMPLTGLAVTVAALYFLFALAAIYLSRQPGSIATIWYANAIGVSVLQARPLHQWPALLGGIAFANIAANLASGDALWLTLGFLPGNVVEMALAAYLLRRFCAPGHCVSQVGMFLKALFLGGVGPALLGALIGAATLSSYGLASFGKVWFSWFEGSALGSVAVLPMGWLILARGRRSFVSALTRPEGLALLLAAVAVSLLAPTSLPYPYVYISVALILLAAVGRFAAAATGVMASSLSVSFLIALGIFQPPPGTTEFSNALFYLPIMLTLVPPMMLAVALERIDLDVSSLAKKEAHFRALYQNAPVMMHSIDTEGALVSVNRAWLARLGYESQEVLGRRSTEFLSPQSHKYAIEVVIPEFRRAGFVNDIAYQMVTRTGEIVDVQLSAIWERDAAGVPVRTLAVSKDVTEQNRLAGALAAEQELIAVTLHSIGDGVVTTDKHGAITYLNPVAEKMVGWTCDEVKGRAFSDVVRLFDQTSREPLLSPVERCLREQLTYGLPENAVLQDRYGKEYGVQDSVAPIRSKEGELLGAVMVFQDVTEARGMAQKMSYLAHHDGLTDLPNRILFQDRVYQACQYGQRNDERFAVIFMDLDHFKHVNDSLGHAVGDTLLKTVAKRLTDVVRGSDTVCRLGGDEFVMLVTELETPSDAEEVAKKILREVAVPCILEDTEINVSVSVGIAVFPEDGKEPDSLMKHADTAMYRAKRSGRNRYHFFSQSVDDAASARLRLEADMRRGLQEGQFVVHYQPIVCASGGNVFAVEALARWLRNGQGMQNPALFIPVAEESGLIVQIGAVVLRQACEQLRQWSDSGLGHITIAVNVSPVQLAHPDFISMVSETLTAKEIEGSRLEFEITESSLINDADATLNVLKQIKTLGIRLAIDDFGTGYSSLSYLKRFPVDKLKIDRSFVTDLETDSDDHELVKAILAIAKSLRLHVVAEGVETLGQADILRVLECSYLQGFLFAKPSDPETTTAWLQARLLQSSNS